MPYIKLINIDLIKRIAYVLLTTYFGVGIGLAVFSLIQHDGTNPMSFCGTFHPLAVLSAVLISTFKPCVSAGVFLAVGFMYSTVWVCKDKLPVWNLVIIGGLFSIFGFFVAQNFHSIEFLGGM